MKNNKHYIIQSLLEGTRRITENDDVEIELTGKQVKELEQIFKQFNGADINDVLVATIKEAMPQAKRGTKFTQMSSKEIEEIGVVIKIDAKIIDTLEECLDAGKEAKRWYHEVNEMILEAFSESDGVLFLILFAIFSPRQTLTVNLRLASRAYAGIKQDIEDPKKLKLLEEFMELPNMTVVNIIEAEYGKKLKGGEYEKFAELNLVNRLGREGIPTKTYTANLTKVLKMYKKKNYTFTREDAIREISQHFKDTGDVSKDGISAQKVFSFTLNLLDPNFQTESGWLPVTIDTWMLSFFYPYMDKEDAQELLKKHRTYTYLAKVTQELAARYGMAPHEMQAAIWVAMIKKEKGPNYATGFEGAIRKNIKILELKIDELQDLRKILKQVILEIAKH
ncbi:hypothetical protein [Microcystis phage Mel-JY01]